MLSCSQVNSIETPAAIAHHHLVNLVTSSSSSSSLSSSYQPVCWYTACCYHDDIRLTVFCSNFTFVHILIRHILQVLTICIAVRLPALRLAFYSSFVWAGVSFSPSPACVHHSTVLNLSVSSITNLPTE